MGWLCSFCNQIDYHLCIDCLKTYIAEGEDLNAQDEEGNTALHYLTDRALVDFLVKAGADPTIRNNKGYLPVLFEQRVTPRPKQEAPLRPKPEVKRKMKMKEAPPAYRLNEKQGIIEIYGRPFADYSVRKDGRLEFRSPATKRLVLLEGNTGQLLIKEAILSAAGRTDLPEVPEAFELPEALELPEAFDLDPFELPEAFDLPEALDLELPEAFDQKQYRMRTDSILPMGTPLDLSPITPRANENDDQLDLLAYVLNSQPDYRPEYIVSEEFVPRLDKTARSYFDSIRANPRIYMSLNRVYHLYFRDNF